MRLSSRLCSISRTSFLETLIASPVARVVAPRSRLWSRLLSRPSPRHVSSTSIVSGHVSCHVFGHVLCHVCRDNCGPVSRHHFQHISDHACVSRRLTSRLRHISPPAFRGLSHVSSHDPTLAFRVTSLVTCFVTTSRSLRRGFTVRFQNAHRATARSIRPMTRPAQSAQRVRFAISKCEPRHSESDSTNPKPAEGSVCDLKMCAEPPQREQFDPPKVRRGLTLCDLQMRTMPQRPVKVLRLPRNLHASWKAPCLPRNLHDKLQSAAPATKSARTARKCCACPEK